MYSLRSSSFYSTDRVSAFPNFRNIAQVSFFSRNNLSSKGTIYLQKSKKKRTNGRDMRTSPVVSAGESGKQVFMFRSRGLTTFTTSFSVIQSILLLYGRLKLCWEIETCIRLGNEEDDNFYSFSMISWGLWFEDSCIWLTGTVKDYMAAKTRRLDIILRIAITPFNNKGN